MKFPRIFTDNDKKRAVGLRRTFPKLTDDEIVSSVVEEIQKDVAQVESRLASAKLAVLDAKRTFEMELGISSAEKALELQRQNNLTVRETIAIMRGKLTMAAVNSNREARERLRRKPRKKFDALRRRLPGSFESAQR